MFVSIPTKSWFTTCLVGGTTVPGVHMANRAKIYSILSRGREERTREMFKKVELSISSYDTAWIAMVPSLDSPNQPCFPECLNWLLENQLHDGSWSLPCRHHLLIKDSMLSTLACILALRRWEIGNEHVKKGLEFLGSNFEAVIDKKQLSPIGFDVIFPGMIEYAKDLGLNLPLSRNFVQTILWRRDLEFQRFSRNNSKENKAHLAYISEGLMNLYDWKEVMKFQRKNGSLFNSPSTTAAALLQYKDVKCSEYLHSVVRKFGNAVPTIYPLDVYARLSMVDHLERLGSDRHFRNEVKDVLDDAYRCWVLRDDEIFLDIETCALAFRLLRTNGYAISSDELAEFNEQEFFYNSAIRHPKDINTVLELYKASQIRIYPHEPVLEILHSWTSRLLRQYGGMHHDKFNNEVEHALTFTYNSRIERLGNRRTIECYNVDTIHILKTSYRCSNIGNRDFLELAAEDYNYCQGIHQKELKNLERWIKENRLDQLSFARQRLKFIYFSVASILYTPELSDARISWTKNAYLATVVDDFFDVEGSREELVNLIKSVEKWDGNSTTAYCSKRVEIIFLALHKTINELGAIASTRQGRNVTSHMIDLWLTLLKSMMREYEWVKNKSAPMMDEYMENACISFALGPVVLITLYFIGPKLSQETIESQEYNNLFKHLNMCARLCNDVQSFKREGKEGKLNSVLLYTIHGYGTVTEEEAVVEIKTIIECNKKELLSLVLLTEEGIVPKSCKDLFWKASRIISLVYNKNDGFTSPLEMLSAVNAVLHEPIKVPM